MVETASRSPGNRSVNLVIRFIPSRIASYLETFDFHRRENWRGAREGKRVSRNQLFVSSPSFSFAMKKHGLRNDVRVPSCFDSFNFRFFEIEIEFPRVFSLSSIRGSGANFVKRLAVKSF
mgnify:CR=1 FL=1